MMLCRDTPQTVHGGTVPRNFDERYADKFKNGSSHIDAPGQPETEKPAWSSELPEGPGKSKVVEYRLVLVARMGSPVGGEAVTPPRMSEFAERQYAERCPRRATV